MPAFKWEFYKGTAGQWQWRKKRTKNGQIVIASSKTFDSWEEAVADARTNGYRGGN